MFRRLRSPVALVRFALLAMLAFGLVLQPVLASIGEVQELTSHFGTVKADGQAFGEHNEGVSGQDQPGSTTGDEQGDSPWHLVSHSAHCCGHAQTALTPACLDIPASFAASIVPDSGLELPLVASAFEPQRPPIL